MSSPTTIIMVTITAIITKKRRIGFQPLTLTEGCQPEQAPRSSGNGHCSAGTHVTRSGLQLSSLVRSVLKCDGCVDFLGFLFRARTSSPSRRIGSTAKPYHFAVILARNPLKNRSQRLVWTSMQRR